MRFPYAIALALVVTIASVLPLDARGVVRQRTVFRGRGVSAGAFINTPVVGAAVFRSPVFVQPAIGVQPVIQQQQFLPQQYNTGGCVNGGVQQQLFTPQRSISINHSLFIQ